MGEDFRITDRILPDKGLKIPEAVFLIFARPGLALEIIGEKMASPESFVRCQGHPVSPGRAIEKAPPRSFLKSGKGESAGFRVVGSQEFPQRPHLSLEPENGRFPPGRSIGQRKINLRDSQFRNELERFREIGDRFGSKDRIRFKLDSRCF